MSKLEQDIKNKLNAYPSPMDTDRLWAGVARELQGKKKRRPWFWLCWLGLALGGALGLMLWMPALDPEGGSHAEAPAVMPRSAAPSPASVHEAAPGDARPSAGSQAQATLLAAEAWGERVQNATYRTSSTQNAKAAGAEGGLFAGRRRSSQASAAALMVSGRAFSGEALTWDAPVAAAEAAAWEASAPALEQGLYIPLAVLPVSPLPVTLAGLRVPALETPRPGCPTWGGQGKQRPMAGKRVALPYVGVYALGAYPLKRLEAAEANRSLLQRQADTERVLDAWGAGLNLGLTHRSGLGLELGVEYLQINERFRYQNRVIDTIGSMLVRYTLINAPGDTSFTEILAPIVQETRTERITYNRYRMIQAPIAVHYVFSSWGSRWQPYISVGAAINLHFAYKAELMTGPDAPGTLYRSKEAHAGHPFRTRLGLAPLGVVGMRYALGDRLALCGSVSYRHPGGSLTRDDYPVSRRYGLPGVGLGLIWGGSNATKRPRL